MLKLYLLGGFRLLADDTPVTALNTPRLQALLAYLALHRHAPQPRAHLAFLFWPDSSEAQARTNLRYLLHQLRQALPQVEQYLHTGDGALHWRADAPFTLDVADFEQAITEANRAEQAGNPAEMRATLERAVSLYQGDLLPSCYDEWLLSERERLQQACITILERLILLLESQRDYPSAIAYSQRLLRHDPLHEAGYHHLMRLHAASGDRVGALRVYHTCVTVLQRELAVEPSAIIRAEYERLWHQEPPAGPAFTLDVSAAHPLSSPSNNLPTPLTTFIGREHEMAEIKQLLVGARLLTLTGSGGCGKTRLALEVATELLLEQAFADGVWWVELAALADPALVPQAVASALGVQEQPGKLLRETLSDYLRPKKLLLILDNCEHLVAACAQLAEGLLRTCPKLKVLATSREQLSVNGETIWPTPSLSLPDPRHLSSKNEEAISALSQSEAVRLFVERAASTLPTFTLTQRNAAEVVQICRRLDGIPLAIELAAARVKVLTVSQITARLDDSFKLLAAGSRTAASRHQTLKAAIDWSYNLLGEAERVLFQRLAVFEGGFILEAAEAICAGRGIEAIEILELLSYLVDKSLVVVGTSHPGREARYRLLETMRQYGRDKLVTSADAEWARQQHAAYYLKLAELSRPKLQGPEQLAWLDRLEIEHDNLRAAVRWSQASETGLQLAGTLGLFWYLHGHWSEGRGWLESMLAQTEGLDYTQARAKALLNAGTLAHYQGDYHAATALLNESLTLHRELGDKVSSGWALYRLGHTADRQGNYEQAAALLGDSVMLFRQAGDKWGAALSLCILGWATWHLNDYELAAMFCQESLALSQELGYPRGVAWALYCLGGVTMSQGDYGQAATLSRESLALFRQFGIKDGIALSLHTLGYASLFQGNYGPAASSFAESLALRQELGDRVGLAHSLAGLAGLAGMQGRMVEAARLFGAAELLLDTIKAFLEPFDQAAYDRHVAAVHATMGETAFEAAWLAGRVMDQEQVIAEALRLTAKLNSTAGPAPVSAPSSPA
ncbi:MAG: BTAD domain-containing putative transcriptional regulator [Anaerolineae bacterium]